ncbi:MAG TPA: DUF4291 domain-containing protein [Xanthomonadaceae bacterium]|nr:DUF4291 domain-containing protein [Xanthomonadaceae bacterium]
MCTWPRQGRHILAHFDDESVVVYQAYRPAIATWAVGHQRFGGEFSYGRMSWIKPNFLWMMYRCGWASKEGQEHVLAVRLRRPFFDEILRRAVPSSFDASRYASVEAWRRALDDSEVRLQWDPDHDPLGRPLERRAIQLGLRGSMLRRYGETELLSIEDVTPLVIGQRERLERNMEALEMPREEVYQPESEAAAAVGIDRHEMSSRDRLESEP